MSGVRSLFLGCLALLAPVLLLACTEPNPNYCDGDHPCQSGLTCNTDRRACVTAVGDAGHAGQDGGPGVDAPADRPADAPAEGGGDAPRDGAGADADGAVAEVHTGCATNNDCTADANRPVCEYRTGLCVGCLTSADCTATQARVCDTAAKTCVQCLAARDCTDPTAPICEATICRGCKVDSECAGIGPQVCMAHIDGHCAIDDETVYVLNLAGSCSDSGPGSRTSPICKSQVAIDLAVSGVAPVMDAGVNDDGGTDGDGAARADADDSGIARKVIKDLVVMRGPSLTPWSFATPDRALTVIGQEGATVVPGGFEGVRVDAGTLYLRNLHVTGGTFGPGIIARGGEIHVDRCVIDTNLGGMLIDGAGFEITNTIIANNLQGTFQLITPYGGAILGAVPAGKPARFQNNTVISNQAPGVLCSQGNPHDISASIFANNTLGDGAGCTVAVCCAGDPGLTSDSRFTSAASPCKDKLAATLATAYDIDGQSRPSGALSDCGADEYLQPTP